MTELDEIDRRLLRALQADGRITNQALARKIHLSPAACSERVKRLRERAGLSRAQFAEMCEINTGTVRSHENNQAPMSEEAATAYATVLGTSVALIQRGRD